jgi:hypothetical protein
MSALPPLSEQKRTCESKLTEALYLADAIRANFLAQAVAERAHWD